MVDIVRYIGQISISFSIYLKTEKRCGAKKNYGGCMRIKRTDNGRIYFYVDKEYFKKYGLEIETFRTGRPFKAEVFDSLLDKAEKEYDAKFGKDATLVSISVKENAVIFEVKEKSNIVQAENEYIENKMIAKGIWELLRMLPDEKINMGIIDADKKRGLLKQIRNDESMQYIWEKFMY